ncbi:MAG: 2-C-methyl-D-erythritol 2,4-cyclodiphosphate synthase [Bacteroidales bacterium]|nr:2-C-methyl-D-erythritol 2,4-cyclodiphosphate synthase [Bacteroidales bacterium]
MRIGLGYDSHRLAEGRPLVLGGVTIPFEKGCVAHSDGDALIHAICDALLGAAGLSDIGSHFPDTDEQYKNIDSKILLSKVVELLYCKGLSINNIDITIVIERPKMAPYHDEMVRTLAEVMRIAPERLSIKAKTNEKMGFVGRGEGVVCFAICTLAEEIKN